MPAFYLKPSLRIILHKRLLTVIQHINGDILINTVESIAALAWFQLDLVCNVEVGKLCCATLA